ncbi:hypothetical protein DLJ53_31805 [Acuticoccus sediminis]|uniref:EAL domain, c-di-GMP-specific phosphodiesterase class I (Or its enzymatically inactive variant) n=1 Tax=Acuticoccus sediminis TaxID=2184697 RepID=A0A8B2ND57_9HYPH|nr:EAL domain-containing response regulator [Acuticoccus sediminis]RAH96504.1 hypothetical protein DLJ53_31805 [Acuticoccus sediminis]
MTSKRVAILDDEADIRTLLSMVLSSAGLSTSVWGNGLELIDELARSPVDVVVCDLIMPDCDGVEFFAKLAGLEGRPALVLVSGQDERTRQLACALAKEYGVDVIGVFGKPIDFAALEACICEHIGRLEGEPDDYDIETALAEGQLRAHYQPIFSVSEGRRLSLWSVEALARWEHPVAGLLMPGDFLPRIHSVATWERFTCAMLTLVCEQILTWRQSGFTPRVAVNIPPLLLGNRELPRLIEDITQRHDVDPSQIILELTEEGEFASLLDDKAVLMRLKMRGYSISVDDFGIGYSSLKRLQGGLFDQIKIDRSFVVRADKDEDARSILSSTAALAHSLGMSVCAEGVESYEIMREALSCGCSHLQGYGLGRPINGAMLEMQFAPETGPRAGEPGAGAAAFCENVQ